jgi:hypothetical protein
MAAISPVAGPQGSMNILRNVTAQIGNSVAGAQIDWVDIPSWVRGMTIYLNLSALAGTTRTLDFKLVEADPVARSDSAPAPINYADWDGITQLTATGFVVVEVGPGLTGIADDDTASYYKLNAQVGGKLLGFRIATDRTDGDETYTYTLAVVFHK